MNKKIIPLSLSKENVFTVSIAFRNLKEEKIDKAEIIQVKEKEYELILTLSPQEKTNGSSKAVTKTIFRITIIANQLSYYGFTAKKLLEININGDYFRVLEN